MKRRIVSVLALLGAGAALAQTPDLQPLPEP